MFGSLGGPEVLLIFVLALLLFGPRKLPEIGRMLGRSVAEFRKATNEFRSTLEREVHMEELKEIKGVGTALRTAGEETIAVAREASRLKEPTRLFDREETARPGASSLGVGQPGDGRPETAELPIGESGSHVGDPRKS